ncbi:bifunctional UDP-sugar hydrolase/5'-nucleotidase UshA [Bowmanella sp. Y26]|uniref:bifunctional UDP-sugar hydrolase/5'-nucleotidase UshA n=1 Tax=Bowmanella yangjiangensis TaxID=2811230 RepID=UPI001BDCE2D6|nr:bifunctional UDP-sugar hydrolase/5'-nucleotidase UshA [Bowmanella yangjiangensis]MBT1065373.1 bifunctional UDP-sugar hydrolase/5'-nucleotidase UshA [Bowmanella yangjiangensis]
MRLSRLRLLVIPAVVSVLLACANHQPEPPLHFTILHTNDHHGRFWRNEQGEYGMAARKTLIEQIRQEVEGLGGSVLLFSGGDINTGVPESDMQQAKPDFLGMRLLGYDAMALGNHEFDNPLEVIEQQRQWAGFPMLSANIYDRKTGQRRYQAYQMFERQGLRIAVLGLTTEDTAKIGNPEYIRDLEFRDPKAEAVRLVAELKVKEQPDLIIVLTHMGHYDNGQHAINAPGDVTLARTLPTGSVAMVIGGHSQEPLCMERENVRQVDYQPGSACKPDHQNGIWIMQAHEWGKYVGRADFVFQQGKLTLQDYQLLPVNLKGINLPVIAEHSEMLELLTPYQEIGRQQLSVTIGETLTRLDGDRTQVRFEQTNLGRLIGAAQSHKVGADLAVISGGGIRDSIAAGPISYKDVLKVQPFGNTLAYVDMSGQELYDYLAQVATKPIDTGAYPQFFSVSMTLHNGQPQKVLIGGEPIQMERTYRLALNSYNASGGDGYPVLTGHAGYVNTGFVDADVLREFIAGHSPIDGNTYLPIDSIRQH